MAASAAGGFLDLPQNVLYELYANAQGNIVVVDESEKVYRYKIDIVQCYTEEMPSGKKYVIQMNTEGLQEFKAEFYPNELDNNTIDFSRDWGFYKATTSFPNANVEEFVSDWLVNLLSEQQLCFDKVVMEIFPKSERLETRICSVQTLDITIPNQPYEDGLLEYWLEKFQRNIKLLIITSMTQQVNIPNDPDIFCADDLELKGLFDIPVALFPRITATKITFEDLSGTSIINSEVICLILNDWLAVLGTRRDIKFNGNYGEEYIETSVEKYLGKKANLRSSNNLTREYLFESGSQDERAMIVFYKSHRDLNLKIIPIDSERKVSN